MERLDNPADKLVGTLARLPNRELVEIETVYDDGYARVIRLDGDRAGTAAVCQISKLEAADQSMVTAAP